jgi:hypothetical protein
LTTPNNPRPDPADPTPRPGSRAARMRMPLAGEALREIAQRYGVCVRPLAIRRIDSVTGQADIIEVPCGARLASKCKPCAERNRRARIQQISEGWHLAEEPAITPDPPGTDVLALVRLRAHLEFGRDESLRAARWDDVHDCDDAINRVDAALAESDLRGHLTPTDRDAPAKRTRSTKRRQDVPDLPRLPVAARTIGRTYAGRAGKTYRPSMLVTLTLPSHGPVHTQARAWRGGPRPCGCGQLHGQQDPLLGTPLDPASYDYRQAAADAIHFARVLDRWWQNLRRAAGWNVQYAGCVELQKRLAPHGHFAIRGTLPRRLLKQVAAATYHHVWWPPFEQPMYTVDIPPTWDAVLAAYVEPRTGQPLRTWAEALDELEDADAYPAFVARLGSIDARGINEGTDDARRSIRYVTKYITKDLADQSAARSDEQRAHFDRLHAQLAVLPCSPTCANWLLYGIQPDGAKAGLVPGRCTGKVHQPRTLGFTGRRVLISRQWSGKTLADHRADNRAWIRAILAGSVDQADTASQDQAAIVEPAAEPGRYTFELAKPGSPGVAPVEHRILRAISTRIQWREQLRKARQLNPGGVSANEITKEVGVAA